MQLRRPSLALVAGLILVVLAIVFVFFGNGEATDSSEADTNEGRSSGRFGSTIEMWSNSRVSSRPVRVSRIEKLISERFSEEHEAAFYAYQDGMSLSYTERGLMDFYGQMRNALRGDEDSVAEIFTTYRVGEDESYGVFINILIENLGDDFFFRQIQRQPESTQSMILGQIWQKIDRFPLDYQSDGSIPVADSGWYYPKTGELFLKLLENKLETDHWQQQKRKRSEQAAPSNGG